MTRRFKLADHVAGALDALYGVDTLGETILASLGLDGAEIASSVAEAVDGAEVAITMRC